MIDDDNHALETEASSPLSSPRASPVVTKRRLRVKISLAFNESFPIANRASMGIEDVRATWYDKSEYNAMKSDIIPILRRVMKNEVVEGSICLTSHHLIFSPKQPSEKNKEIWVGILIIK